MSNETVPEWLRPHIEALRRVVAEHRQIKDGHPRSILQAARDFLAAVEAVERGERDE